MDLKVFTEESNEENSDLTNAYEKMRVSSLTVDNKNENINCSDFNRTESIAPVIKSHVHLVEEGNKIREYKLNFKGTNGREFRVYEVENLVIGKPVEYLYKTTIFNIIRNKLTEAMGKELTFEKEVIMENYINQLNQILKNS